MQNLGTDRVDLFRALATLKRGEHVLIPLNLFEDVASSALRSRITSSLSLFGLESVHVRISKGHLVITNPGVQVGFSDLMMRTAR